MRVNNKAASPLCPRCAVEAMSSPCSRRHGRTAAPGPPPPAPESLQQAAEARDWATLPRDIVLDIFLRLEPREVMLGAEFACKPWRSVALEEPMLWRRVGMESPFEKHWRWRNFGAEMAMKLVAVDRAAGQCEAFKGHCDYEYLLNLVERAPSLKCLSISKHYSDYQSGEDLVEALMKLLLLEELEVCFNYIIEDMDETILRSICQACPRLKKLVLLFASASCLECNEDEYSKQTIDGEIPVMPKLGTLKLYDCDLKVERLKAILDSCPVLETLHTDGYLDMCEMDKELRLKCARVKDLTLPIRISSATNSEDEYYYLDTDSEDDDSLEEEEEEEEEGNT